MSRTSGSSTSSACAAMRRVFARSLAHASSNAPAAAITVLEANAPVLSGEKLVLPACTATAS